MSKIRFLLMGCACLFLRAAAYPSSNYEIADDIRRRDAWDQDCAHQAASNAKPRFTPGGRLTIETVIVRIPLPALEDRDGLQIDPRAPATTHTEFLQARDLDKVPDDVGLPTTIKEATTTADPDRGNEAELVLCGNFGCPKGYTFNSAQLGICLCRKIHDQNDG
ncbi:hypothetical protein LTR84_011219 [Exophiala bonariae]|uniref:Uncharacterized protein n=1 Tax=Exophiala bonariae TaxID=1690606 RepID=A0AAV9NIL2_9EURO|nr:hypothetical protein LTR84_011219 [Exophiala bonariae]